MHTNIETNNIYLLLHACIHEHTHTISIPRACFSMKFCSLPELSSSSYSHVCRPFSQCNRHFVTSVTGPIGSLCRLPCVVVAMWSETQVQRSTWLAADKPASYVTDNLLPQHSITLKQLPIARQLTLSWCADQQTPNVRPPIAPPTSSFKSN